MPEPKIDPVDQIEFVRSVNNSLWMQILRIALDCDPDATREVLRKINQCDQKISKLLGEIADNA